jgi:hypothetical protein
MQNPDNLDYLVSNVDILQKLRSFSVKIIIYPDLQKIKNINELLPTNYCAVCILIKTTANSGH